MRRHRLLSGLALWLAAAVPAHAVEAYVSNEKGNTVSVVDTDNWTVTKTIKVGQRPRGIEFTRDGKYVMVAVGDDDTIQMIDTKTKEVVDTLPSGPDPELFTQDAAGKLLYTQYLYPFEIAAVILLVAIVAAITLTMRQREGQKVQDIARQVAVRAQDRVRVVKMDAEVEK